MNEAPNNQSGLGETFSSQPATQTNPFTADLKGEFTSNFGTNTNAVSQIFKEGGFVNNNRTKYLIIGGVVIAVFAILFFVMTGEDSVDENDFAEDDMITEDTLAEEGLDDEPLTTEEDVMTDDSAMTESTAMSEATATDTSIGTMTDAATTSMGSGAISLIEPADGSMLSYDETQGPAVFSWEGGGGYIVFARNSSMSPAVFRIPVSGNSYSFHNPWPGTWYWKVENSGGSTEVRSFQVNGPARRNIMISEPAAGGAVSGNGGTVSWQGDGSVAYYRVEFATGSWANPDHRYATSGNSVSLNGVAPGQYQMRVGAFSEVSGRWEYTSPVSVTVQ